LLRLHSAPKYRRKPTTLALSPTTSPTRIEGSGHFIAEEKPAALLAYLSNFLN
jgi:hypothetical protein